MDTVSFDNLEQIAQLLQLSYTGDTTAVKEATEMIDQLSQSSFLFAEALLKIIKVEKSDRKLFFYIE